MTSNNYNGRGFGASFTTLRIFRAAPPTSYWNGTHCIYALVDPRDNTVRYVGYTRSPRKRLQWHINKPLKSLELWLFSLKAAKLKPKMVILDRLKKHQWSDAEILWIAHGRALGRLYNRHGGGHISCGDGPKRAETSEERPRKRKKKRKKWRNLPRHVEPTGVLAEAAELDSAFARLAF